MGDRRYSNREDNSSGDYPAHSRLFIVCDKQLKEDDFKEAFSKFGHIEDIRIPRDHNSGEPKGVVYIKYSKTSHAAAALEEMHSKPLANSLRPLKVMVAASRSGIHSDYDGEMYKRLFITISKTTSEEEIKEYFRQFGVVTSVTIQKDRNTGESKGFAYVAYAKFSEAAAAFEEADGKYRAIFAMPKSGKRPETVFESNINVLASTGSSNTGLISMMNVQSDTYTRLCVMCSPYLTKYHIEQLFDIVPGMVQCQYTLDYMREYSKAFITYSNPKSAAYAVKKLHNFEYPPGQRIFVKPDFSSNSFYKSKYSDVPKAINNLKSAMYTATSSAPDLAQLVDAIAQASNLIKAATAGSSDMNAVDNTDLNYCSVSLPPPKPLADINSPIVKRCFLVCQPQPPPLNVLRDIFCRFGDLINVYTIPNKTVGYACYASAEAANEAIKVLHGADICGIRTKVLEAEEKRGSNDHDHSDKRMRYN